MLLGFCFLMLLWFDFRAFCSDDNIIFVEFIIFIIFVLLVLVSGLFVSFAVRLVNIRLRLG